MRVLGSRGSENERLRPLGIDQRREHRFEEVVGRRRAVWQRRDQLSLHGRFASDDKARDPFLDRTLEVYGTPTPTPWKAYYLPAGANGKYDLRLVDPVKNGLKPFKESQ